MPIDPLPVWISAFEKINLDPTGKTSPKEIADFLDERVTKKLELASSFSLTPIPQFTWQKGVFEKMMKIVALSPSPDPLSPAIKLATAWQSATVISLLVIPSGSKIDPPPPGTNGIAASAVAVIDPATLAAAFSALVADLSSSGTSTTRAGAAFPKAFRKAFSSITYTVSGVDTKPPPTGPIPFISPFTPVM